MLLYRGADRKARTLVIEAIWEFKTAPRAQNGA
jgi:hypothetical protein